jgi:hypothetical protein
VGAEMRLRDRVVGVIVVEEMVVVVIVVVVIAVVVVVVLTFECVKRKYRLLNFL